MGLAESAFTDIEKHVICKRTMFILAFVRTRLLSYEKRIYWAVVSQRLRTIAVEQWYSTFFVHVPPDVISLQLYTPKVVSL
jgi:hypothetical protein